tara:strand:+ start:204 stop:308 length:105 start_codon:yes stop_codon:yes gene_type:complete
MGLVAQGIENSGLRHAALIARMVERVASPLIGPP